ncbi:hypothetical protein HMPREF0860_0415 [Treponema socranskii subsp. socranskii VPI DR56BR1116 = ATCC 35536]|uniref:Uncharacterized protein n=1 Tax=Treponema socranskii subsp. socranskii VPI DR56BR1116 = ATCC 35536 TaxID=1125725 RepID=A0ABN0P285_TRESO|nr:hypothetical protein HMPREF0860_0415 [Treponema socranskii subsp. socranskii VPI DR56BR1116 = ATCC 35536]
MRSVYSADIVVSNRFSSGGTHKDSMAVFMHIVNTYDLTSHTLPARSI